MPRAKSWARAVHTPLELSWGSEPGQYHAMSAIELMNGTRHPIRISQRSDSVSDCMHQCNERRNSTPKRRAGDASGAARGGGRPAIDQARPPAPDWRRRRSVFITGGTGYIGRRLIPELLAHGHEVRALVRAGAERRLPRGASAILGAALQHASYAAQARPADTFVHLVGVSHPSPAKAALFRSVDVASVREAVTAGTGAGVRHFVYVSVAQPAPVMREYQQARAESEALIRESGLDATILRPWYVLGPGHRWPIVLLPLYWVFGRLPASRETAQRLGLVTLRQMIRALAAAVEASPPPQGVRVISVPEIRATRTANYAR